MKEQQEKLEKLEKMFKDGLKEIEALKNEKPKFKKGDWLYYDGTGLITGFWNKAGIIGKYKDEGFNFIGLTEVYHQGRITNCCSNIPKSFRLATPQEVEQHLIEEAKKRQYKLGCKLKPLPNGSDTIDDISKAEFCYYENKDDLQMHGTRIYQNGSWAEIIKEDKILIGGYKVNFHSTYITVNACAYTKTDLLQIYHVLKMEQVRSLNVGCQGQIKVTLEDINQILDKLK